MKTGNTVRAAAEQHRHGHASMEPGHEDREYVTVWTSKRSSASSLNGARP